MHRANRTGNRPSYDRALLRELEYLITYRDVGHLVSQGFIKADRPGTGHRAKWRDHLPMIVAIALLNRYVGIPPSVGHLYAQALLEGRDPQTMDLPDWITIDGDRFRASVEAKIALAKDHVTQTTDLVP